MVGKTAPFDLRPTFDGLRNRYLIIRPEDQQQLNRSDPEFPDTVLDRLRHPPSRGFFALNHCGYEDLIWWNAGGAQDSPDLGFIAVIWAVSMWR